MNTGGGTGGGVVDRTSNPTDWFAFAGNNAGVQNCHYGLNGVSRSRAIATYDPLRGDPFFQLDMLLSRTINFGDRAKLELVARAFS